MNMKIDNKYLGIFSCFFLICTIFILYDFRQNPLQEDFETISTNAGSLPVDYSVGGSGTNNFGTGSSAAVTGTSISTNMDPSQINRAPISSTSGFSVTDQKDVSVPDKNASSKNISSKDGSITTAMDVISEGSSNCDPDTAYSMKNVMQDNNGNIIIRYMDTCGKYYTYQYNQTINKVQNIVTPKSQPPPNTEPPTTQPPTTSPPTTSPPTTTPPAVDSKAISSMVSKVLK